MTTIQITLPDELVQEAEQAGLLSPESLARMLRQELNAPTLDQIFETMDRVGEPDDEINFSPEAIAEEIRAMRAEKRAQTPA